MARKKKMKMDVVNLNAAGIDIGSKSHFVSIGQNKQKDVIEFGVYAEDLTALRKWLQENGIETVAMESTGNYWQNLYIELISNGLEVILTNGKFTKNTSVIRISKRKHEVNLTGLSSLSSLSSPKSVTMKSKTNLGNAPEKSGEDGDHGEDTLEFNKDETSKQ